MPRPAPPVARLCPEEFVKVWQSSATLAEAAKRAGCTSREASVRAFNLRKAGVKLKTFSATVTRIDVEALNKVVKQTK